MSKERDERIERRRAHNQAQWNAILEGRSVVWQGATVVHGYNCEYYCCPETLDDHPLLELFSKV